MKTKCFSRKPLSCNVTASDAAWFVLGKYSNIKTMENWLNTTITELARIRYRDFIHYTSEKGKKPFLKAKEIKYLNEEDSAQDISGGNETWIENISVSWQLYCLASPTKSVASRWTECVTCSSIIRKLPLIDSINGCAEKISWQEAWTWFDFISRVQRCYRIANTKRLLSNVESRWSHEEIFNMQNVCIELWLNYSKMWWRTRRNRRQLHITLCIPDCSSENINLLRLSSNEEHLYDYAAIRS